MGMKKGKKKKQKKGIWAGFVEGFEMMWQLDNKNIYSTCAFECLSNVFKDGMWSKLINVYTLMISDYDKRTVGDTMTVQGLTRAISGVICGNILLNKLGCEITMGIAGVFGIIGLVVNFFTFLEGTVTQIFVLQFVWAIFTGLTNSGYETSYARSVIQVKRETVGAARQSLNKGTTALGPLISLIFFVWTGNKWTIPNLTFVMSFGTVMTIIPVLLTFRFSNSAEVKQHIKLRSIKKMSFPAEGGRVKSFFVQNMTKSDFLPDKEGFCTLTYPLESCSSLGDLRILYRETLEESRYIVGRRVRSNLEGVMSDQSVFISFSDESLKSTWAHLEQLHAVIKTNDDQAIDLDTSIVVFNQIPYFLVTGVSAESLSNTMKRRLSFRDSSSILSRCLRCSCWSHFLRKRDQEEPSLPKVASCGSLDESLLGSPGSESGSPKKPTDEEEVQAVHFSAGRSATTLGKSYHPNITGARVIVFCDVLNALGNGMSLRFMDLFLIQEHDFSPVALMITAFITNIVTVWFTPLAKKWLGVVKNHGYHKKWGVVSIWCASLFFLGLICLPRTPGPIVVIAIVMRNSLNTCTKSYNRAKLADYLPTDRVANYMVWDSLNKANQGGIAILGAYVIHYGGYRACFKCTFCLMLFRLVIYIAFSWYSNFRKAPGSRKFSSASTMQDLVGPEAQKERAFSAGSSVGVQDGAVLDPEAVDEYNGKESTVLIDDRDVSDWELDRYEEDRPGDAQEPSQLFGLAGTGTQPVKQQVLALLPGEDELR